MVYSYDTSVKWDQRLETYIMPLEGGKSYVYIQEPSDGEGKQEMLELHRRYYTNNEELKDANLTLSVIYEKLGLDGEFDAEKALSALHDLRKTSNLYYQKYQDDCENAYVTQTEYKEVVKERGCLLNELERLRK